MVKKNVKEYCIALVLLFLYIGIAYKVQRYETIPLFSLYAALFALYAWIIFSKDAKSLTFWIACAIGFRFILLFSIPNLSEDFYRFIWDGRLLASGYHPFAHPPSYYVDNNVLSGIIDYDLYSKLNSKDYFTIYPPVAQFLFWISAKLSTSVHGSLIVLKAFNFIAEIGSIIMLKKLLHNFSLSKERVLIYALNPLIIIELTGNAHFEAVMIFFILSSLYFLRRKKSHFSAIAMAFGIGVKLIPAIFLPALKQIQGWKYNAKYIAVVGVVLMVLFLPLLNWPLLNGLANSIPYFFSRFEFNASVYYVVREVGYAVFGFNTIGVAGPLLSLIALLLILKISYNGLPKLFLNSPEVAPGGSATKELSYIQTIAGCLLIYYLFTTILHPWYITTLLALSVFTNYRFIILWTFMIFLTYAGYTKEGFYENLWLVSLEYISIVGYLVYELRKKSMLLKVEQIRTS